MKGMKDMKDDNGNNRAESPAVYQPRVERAEGPSQPWDTVRPRGKVG